MRSPSEKDGNMSFDFGIKISEKTQSNLKALSKKQSVLEERRICELSELALDIVNSASELYSYGMSIYEILTLLSESPLLPVEEPHTEAMKENVFALKHYLSGLSSLDKSQLSRLIFEKLSELGINIGEKDFLQGVKLPETFVYVKNSYADEAYDVFSQDFVDPRVRYAKDFKEALSLLSKGEVGYCLLPFEDGGVRIKTVDRLIFSGDFKINAVTCVFGLDGEADMKYCLVSKGFLVKEYSKDDDRYLELRAAKDSDDLLSELIFVAESLGSSVYRINSTSFASEEGERPYYSILLREIGRDFCKLLIYLTLFNRDFSILGIYKNLE